MSTVTMAFTGQSKHVYIAEISSLDILYLAAKTQAGLLGDILPETSKSSACWEIGGNSNLAWLSSDSLDLP